MFAKLFFKNLEPTNDLRLHADRSLRRALDQAPYGTGALALIEKQETDYRCSIDVYSAQGPITASAVGVTPREAIQGALSKVSFQFEKWSHGNSPLYLKSYLKNLEMVS